MVFENVFLLDNFQLHSETMCHLYDYAVESECLSVEQLVPIEDFLKVTDLFVAYTSSALLSSLVR
jgi:hypothetical protein